MTINRDIDGSAVIAGATSGVSQVSASEDLRAPAHIEVPKSKCNSCTSDCCQSVNKTIKHDIFERGSPHG